MFALALGTMFSRSYSYTRRSFANQSERNVERREILIATKTYPSISRKYKETVCTAGVLLDSDGKAEQWIRIYPIRFRGLDLDQRYARWSIITAEIERNDSDYRVESYRIEDSSIEVLRKIDTKSAWEERKSFVLPVQFNCIADMKKQGKSLGLIKPQAVVKSFVRETDRKWSQNQQATVAQLDIFEPSVQLDKIPYQFGYEFVESDNTPHKFSISDWEIMQLYRNCKDKSKMLTQEGKEKEAVEKVVEKLETFRTKNELYFIVGNLKSHNHVFMIIGLFYPPVKKQDGKGSDEMSGRLF